MGVFNMLVTSAVVGATGSVRAGVGLAELAARRTPSLLVLGARATVGTGREADRAQAVFRDELLALMDDAAQIAWLQARRARDQLGVRTGSPALDPAGAARHKVEAAADNGAERRRHRVKA